MEIELKNLQFETISLQKSSDFWNQSVKFPSGGKFLLKAISGSGKTTAISLLYGLRKDYTGQVLIDGCDIKNLSPAEWSIMRRTKISIVFQELKLFDQLTAEENLRIKLQLTNIPDKILEYSERLGMREHLQKKVKILSVGQKQRIAIIRSLLQPFDYLLLDEPFSHLDPENTQNACALIDEVCSEQQAGLILTSLHDLHHMKYNSILAL